MTKATLAAATPLFAAPFLLLAACYPQLPAEVPVFRGPTAAAALHASKSIFIIFRVPLMNLTHGLMAAIMLSRAPDFKDAGRRASYHAALLTLLFAIAIKSNFEALELAAPALHLAALAPWFTRGTLLSVIGGLAIAFMRARGVPLPWPELRLPQGQKVMLAALFVAYLAIVGAALLIGHRTPISNP